MKKSNPTLGTLAKGLAFCVVILSFLSSGGIAKAHPYASGVTNDNGTIRFVLNEGGGTVQVVFENGTTNVIGVVPKGATNFSLGSHTSYSIYVTKTGNGTPSLISSDAFTNSVWNSPRGVGVNQNPARGNSFGRIYVGNSAAGGTVGTTYKGLGLYAFNADQTDALGIGTNAAATQTFTNSAGSGPYKLRVAPDNTLLVCDFSTAAAALWQFAPDLTSSNLVLGTVGQAAAAAAGIHGDFFGTPLMTGSLAQGNLVLWTADSGMAVPNATIAPSITLGPGTGRGDFNCLFRYDIGAGPVPWTNPPNYAYTVGLQTIAELRTEMDLGKDGKIIGGFGRANLSNPNIQILDPTGANLLWTSWNETGGASDPWRGEANGTTGGTYCGVRVSSDGRFLASVDINNGITIANLTNGIPDDSSIFGIANTSTTGNSRGMSWDAADNIYVVSSGQALLRIYSLGISTTCITSNDYTGTNGSFQLVLPGIAAKVVVSQPLASQNYINSVPAGTPIPGVFTISLDKNHLDAPVAVTFSRSGTAAYLTNYTINLGTNANGVVITSTNVTFPAGNMPGGGNWSVNVQIIPTATPLSGPTLTVGLRVLGGANYLAGTPLQGTVFIANTGPQLLFVSAAASGTTMSRSIPTDYARFLVTRWGDTNGPGSTAATITPASYTVTNFTYLGTAVFPADYTARAQRTDPSGNGVVQLPTDGAPGIVINPGDVVITNVVGNPVSHANLNLPPTDVTIIISLTNSVTGTNAISLQGDSYSVSNNAVTLTEFDNTIGPEVVLWSNPLTNSVDPNWTLTFASTSFATNTQLPVVIPNYVNDIYSIPGGGTNDFNVKLGWPVASDGVNPSPAMAANGWANVLRMTVNKSAPGDVCGVNLYPQGMKFAGNYALRFSMYLSVYSGAINNSAAGSTPREFALFGINHFGTNCNWRLATPLTAGTGSGTTNADGVWFAINAASQSPGSITPADFDAFTSPALTNQGVAADLVSFTASQENGIFKSPPFVTVQPNLGGTPANQWVDVSVEVTKQTNATLYIDRSPILSFIITNGVGFTAGYTNGTPMLGYLDPVSDVSDNSAFVYYSNVRAVELSPYIYAQAASLIVTQGANVSFTSSANFATAPITNIWYLGNTNPVVALQTNTANATNLTSTLSLNNVQTGTNYLAVFSDLAGSVTGLVTSLEVIIPPTDISTNAGATIQFKATASGQAAPTFLWKTNGVNLANSSHYAGVTTGTLTISNVALSDAGTYSVSVTNAAASGFTLLANLTVNATLPPTFSTVSLVGTNVVMSFSGPNAFDTTSSFILQSSTVVQGPYTNTPGTFTGSGGSFQVTTPQTGGNRFYRLQHI